MTMVHPKPDAKAASALISEMEGDAVAIRDLATLLVMAAAGAKEVNPSEAEPALVRIGWLMRDHAEKLETMRGEVQGLIWGLANPAKEARA